jgi:hypothetical protein
MFNVYFFNGKSEKPQKNLKTSRDSYFGPDLFMQINIQHNTFGDPVPLT